MSNDTPTITITTNSARPTYISATSLPSVRRIARPLLPTVAAMAANTPIGANTITYDVNVNITCAVLSNTASTGRPAGPSAASATPKNVANTTTCRMSPRAIASTTDVGNRCRKMSQPLWLFFAMAATADVSPTGMAMPAPGLKMLASPRPMARATVVATSK